MQSNLENRQEAKSTIVSSPPTFETPNTEAKSPTYLIQHQTLSTTTFNYTFPVYPKYPGLFAIHRKSPKILAFFNDWTQLQRFRVDTEDRVRLLSRILREPESRVFAGDMQVLLRKMHGMAIEMSEIAAQFE